MKPGTMMQEVAADQAIMQLMDARGTLMELKVILFHKLADMHALPTAVCEIAISNHNVSYDQEENCWDALLSKISAKITLHACPRSRCAMLFRSVALYSIQHVYCPTSGSACCLCCV